LKGRKEINQNKIGLIGHSEGGLIAPMIAARSKDVHFIVLLAGTGLRGDQLLLLQQEMIAKASGMHATDIQKERVVSAKTFQIVADATSNDSLKTTLTAYLKQVVNDSSSGVAVPNGMTADEFISLETNQITNPWMEFFIKYDPAAALEKVKCPVLAVNGEKDVQVAAKENLTVIKDALEKGGNKNVTITTYPNLNHLFQECATGLPAEYYSIQQTFSPVVLQDVTKWIQQQAK
jgi:pimeloyl-ACP methyl ester carboxylesterase